MWKYYWNTTNCKIQRIRCAAFIMGSSMIAVSFEFPAPTASQIDRSDLANWEMPSFVEPQQYAGTKKCGFNIRAELRNLESEDDGQVNIKISTRIPLHGQGICYE